MATRREGLTLLELLIAVVILAVALLALAAAMTSGIVGIRDDGRRTVANQVATSVIEDIRTGVRETDRDYASLADCALPCDASGSMEAGGQTYEYAYSMEPRLVDSSGTLSEGTPEAYHVLDVGVQVTAPNGRTYAYSTLVARNP